MTFSLPGFSKLLPHHALISVAAPHQWEALAPMVGWLWSSLWVGSPRLLHRGTRISNTCSLWQPATTAHCLPTSHFNLKRENCQTNVLATAHVRVAWGISQQPLPEAEAVRRLGKGLGAAWSWWGGGVLAATLCGLTGSENQKGWLEPTLRSPQDGGSSLPRPLLGRQVTSGPAFSLCRLLLPHTPHSGAASSIS